MKCLLVEVRAPFQQLKAAAPPARAEAVQAGVDTLVAYSSGSIEFICHGGLLAVVKDGVALFADLVICCGPVTPSSDLLQTLQRGSVQARVSQNKDFVVIATSRRRLFIESMLPRMLNVQNRVPHLSSGYKRVHSAAAPARVARPKTRAQSRSQMSCSSSSESTVAASESHFDVVEDGVSALSSN